MLLGTINDDSYLYGSDGSLHASNNDGVAWCGQVGDDTSGSSVLAETVLGRSTCCRIVYVCRKEEQTKVIL